jgi:hypothetical protein
MQYSQRLKGIPHPEGTYTGEYYTAEGYTWYRIDSPPGTFDTTDQPIEIIDLTVYPPRTYYRIEENPTQ